MLYHLFLLEYTCQANTDYCLLYMIDMFWYNVTQCEWFIWSPHKYTTSLSAMLSDRDRKRAHFYVYCAWPCKEMKLGKLRVRCASCRGGAFTVDRDPQCWDDVLEGKRITGDCQNDGCVSEY